MVGVVDLDVLDVLSICYTQNADLNGWMDHEMEK